MSVNYLVIYTFFYFVRQRSVILRKKVAIVDDDLSIGKLLRAALEKNGYDVIMWSSGEEFLNNLCTTCPDALILDIVLPGIDGMEVLKRIRNHHLYNHIPVIILTTKDSEIETVLGLELGADDYLSKPVRYYELIARLKKIFDRSSNSLQKSCKNLIVNGIEINMDNRSVHINGTLISFTYLEYELLNLLLNNPNKVFSRNHLLDLLWHEEQFTETRTVDVHIRRIRRKLEEHGVDSRIIETLRSVGYRFADSKP